MITFAALYYLTPRLWNRQRLYSLRMVNWHFWLATVGIVFYAASMWVAGIMQGLMWREYGSDGYLVYSFAEVVAAMFPMYVIRAAGGCSISAERSSWPTTCAMTIAGNLRTEKPMTETPYNEAADRPPGKERRGVSAMSTLAHKHKTLERNVSLLGLFAFLAVASAASWRSSRCSGSTTVEKVEGMRPYTRSSWPGATSTCAKAAMFATAR
jgi:heme/copper-type cytochrome/quinol oxidase subunit 1